MDRAVIYGDQGVIPQRPKVEGTLKVDLRLFPRGIIEEMMNNPYSVPVLKFVLPRVQLENGMTLETTVEGSQVEIQFVGYEIDVELP